MLIRAASLSLLMVFASPMEVDAATRGQSQGHPASPLSHYDRMLIASCLVLEASGDGREGMQAVLNVIHNRAGHDLKRMIPVMLRPKQFSSLNSVTGRSQPDYSRLLQRAMRDPHFNEAYRLVLELEHGDLPDNTFGADHFYSGRSPYWAKQMRFRVTVGSHRFYSSRPASAQGRQYVVHP